MSVFLELFGKPLASFASSEEWELFRALLQVNQVLIGQFIGPGLYIFYYEFQNGLLFIVSLKKGEKHPKPKYGATNTN